ncbi:MAG: cation diffusion facilitator family transporter [Leptolyngbyaceae cyanobacterium MO_188.B28]|nr:cation diffusion facilitator family transporter [Leptolyngbyaceae cyanobacterium MO_188.B28]
MAIPHSYENVHPNRSRTLSYNLIFLIGLTLNFGFVIVEEWFGFQTHSLSLLADGGHNLRDVLGLLLAWGGAFLAQRRPSHNFTYGLRRASILAALLNSIIILMSMGEVIWEAVRYVQEPAPSAGDVVIWIACIGILIHISAALLFMSVQQKDLNIRVVILHMGVDALISLSVVLTGVGLLLTDWLWLELVVSLIIVAVVVAGAWQLLVASLRLSLDGVPQQVDASQVQRFLGELPGVTQIHNLRIWPISTVEVALTAHLVMPRGYPGDAFLDQASKLLHSQFGIGHVTLQVKTNVPTHFH